MKWPFLAIELAAIFPLAEWLRRNPANRQFCWTVFGVLPFILYAIPHTLLVAPISWKAWPGYVKGVEVSALDVLVVAIFFAQPRSKANLPFKMAMVTYFVAVLFSSVFSDVRMATFFYAWQLVRVFLVYSVVSNACSELSTVRSLLKGLAFGILIEVPIVIWQRFAMDMAQTPGTFGHQNALGMMVQFVVLPYFALILAGQRRWESMGVSIGGIIIGILTASRATLGLLIGGYVAVFFTSAMRKWTARKGFVLLTGIVFFIAVLPFTVSTFEARFLVNPGEGQYDERAAFEAATWMMLEDHPMGVGSNNFVIVANVGGYYERAGVVPVEANRAAHVHNVFLLTLAETGYFGLLSFIILLARPLAVAFLCGWKHRNDIRGELLLGLGISLAIVYIHCFFEWVLLTLQLQYMLAISMGLIVGLARQLGYWKSGFKQRRDDQTRFN